MKIKILALGLILVGGLGLLYGRSTDSRETHEASVGPNDPSVHGETVNFTDLAGDYRRPARRRAPVLPGQEI